jgi:CheY-like chemotaxis protein
VERHPLPAALLHDLRTPLNHIIGYSELVMEQAEADGQTDLLPHLQKVRAAGHHMVSLLEQHFVSLPGRPTSGAVAEESAPAAPGPAPLSRVAPGAAASAAGRGSLLIVDDAAEDRDLLSRRLAQHGYAVQTAEDGPRALEMLGDGTFDLVLLDIFMPEMDGYEVLRRIREDERLRRIPVIMISANMEVDRVVQCLELGAEDYVSKPFDSALLRARIGGTLERKRARDRETYLLGQLQADHRRLKALQEGRPPQGLRGATPP